MGVGKAVLAKEEKALLKCTVPRARQKYVFPKVPIWPPRESPTMRQLEKFYPRGH